MKELKDTDDKVMDDADRSMKAMTCITVLILASLGALASVVCMEKYNVVGFFLLFLINCVGMYVSGCKLFDMAMGKE